MIRSTLAVMAGMTTALAVMLGFEMVGTWMFPMPAGAVAPDASLAEVVSHAPAGKLAWVLAGWLAGALCGGWSSARLMRSHHAGMATAIGVMIVIGVMLNAWMLPHPWWMLLPGVLGPVPMARWGGRLARLRLTAAN